MTEQEQALEDCFTSCAESKGFKETVRLFGRDFEGIVVDYGMDMGPSSGGSANSASFKVVLRKTDLVGHVFTDLEPIRFGPNALRGEVTLAVLGVMSTGAAQTILAGDPMAGKE